MARSFIPVASPHRQYLSLRDGIREAVDRVLESGWYILGSEVSSFENEFARYLGVAHCVTVANGTEALSLSLMACGVKPGDEVITVSHTAVATVAAIELAGAVPVFVDIDPETRCMDASLIATAVTSRTRAVVPVHIYGQPADMRKILDAAREHGLMVVEDCAQATGADISDRKTGSFGHAAAFSFYPTKNLGAMGDGGAIATDDSTIAERARALREYGWRERYISSEPGMNSRLDEIQAAILRVKLPFLDRDNERRKGIALRYAEALGTGPVSAPHPVPGTGHVMHLYVVGCGPRPELQAFLKDRDIGTALHYPAAVHQQAAYAGRIRGGDRLPATEALYRELLSLPMFPELTDDEVLRVCEALSEWRRK